MNFFLYFLVCIDPHIYTNIPRAKNKNLPNLIIIDSLDYMIALILSLITKLYSYNFS